MKIPIIDPQIAVMAARFDSYPKDRPAYSQHGEHVWIDAVVGGLKKGYAVDVGACDGRSLSNTLHLEERGWDVLCIEPNPAYRRALRKNRKRTMHVACGKREGVQTFTEYKIGPRNFEAFSALKPDKAMVRAARAKPNRKFKVQVRTLNACLVAAKFPRLDVVSIDVEGGEADVLAGFDIDLWRPKVVVIEDWMGPRYRRWFCSKGYYALKRLGPNEIFVRVDDE